MLIIKDKRNYGNRMFLSRPTKDKGISIGICYSVLQKCIRRCMTEEALYYGKLIFNDGTPNSLRKRLIQSCLEDMANAFFFKFLLEKYNWLKS